jgi:hypothetical protein
MTDHQVTAARTSDPFDKLLSSMVGLPNGAHTQPAVVQAIDFYGNTTSFMIQTVRTDEGVTAFVTQVNAQGSQRYILPQHVLMVLDRQRAAITTKIRRRHGKRIAEERKAAGKQPGFMKKEQPMRQPNYEMLPEHMREGMQLWVERGIDPGDFLMAVLQNDLMGALGKADSTNIDRLKDYGMFLYNEVPSDCFGSLENVSAWMERGGLLGHE